MIFTEGCNMNNYDRAIVSLGDANYLSAVFDKAEKEKKSNQKNSEDNED